jgi:hypothetical protein
MPASPRPSSWASSRGRPGVLGDDPRYGLGEGLVERLQARANVGVVDQVGLEHQPVCLVVAVNEMEVRAHDGLHALLVVRGGVHCPEHELGQCPEVAVQQGKVQLTLRREVLVEHRLADVGCFSDLIHRGAVVPVGDKNLLGCGQQLGPALVARSLAERWPAARTGPALDCAA